MIRSLLALAYGAVVNTRNFGYDLGFFPQYRSKLSVICVGNVTVGGNGKTPLVIWLAEQLLKLGHSPVILSRGYRSSTPGPYLVQAGSDTAAQVGDEPLMMARRAICPVVIARARVAGAKFIEAQKLGSVIVLDDGLQHRALARDINLICIAAGDKAQVDCCLAGQLLPKGVLREPISAALSRSHAIVWQSRSTNPPYPIPSTFDFAAKPVIRTQLLTSLRPFGSTSESVRAAERPGRCVLVTAIANPEAVLRSLGDIEVIAHRALTDHDAELPLIVDKVRAEFPDVSIVVTEKDAVKLRTMPGSEQLWVLTAQLQVIDSELLITLLRASVVDRDVSSK